MSVMTPEQKTRCHAIIHTAAVAAGAGNAVPIPGVGVAADAVSLSLMAMSLAAVFGGSISEEVARGMAVTAFKETMLKQPIRVIAAAVTNFIPFLGSWVAPVITVGIVEAAGWALANSLALKFQTRLKLKGD